MSEPKHTKLQLALYALSVLMLLVFCYVTWRVKSPWPRLGCMLLVFGCQLSAKLLRHRQLKRFERSAEAERDAAGNRAGSITAR
ncbi:hypothetical protein SAMN04487905_102386 [Actinopolyspora xinjiangensis]|uniref:Uncharacterized protein n=1 Tax=Actinopolyspora xinjiangensis TaxID=405564 RepID=A0A1H0QT77_9ACTN|nr:hypothetical protein [Actinopolyspora xinjiangensis]SDP20547.1 hypothetical protein SAMN04487905_102386 [Actinopolyspora xinjiangensis]